MPMISKFNSKKNFDNNKSYNDKPRYSNKPKIFEKPREIKVPTPCNIQVNLFKYTGKFPVIHFYTISFTPELNEKKTHDLFFKAMEKENVVSGYAYDGQFSLVSTTKIKDFQHRFKCGKVADQEIRGVYQRSVNMRECSSEMIGGLENIVRFDQRLKGNFQHKKTVADTKIEPLVKIDRQGLEIVAGLNATMKHFGGNYYVNLDMAYLVFYQQRSLIDLANIMWRSLSGPNGRSNLPNLKDSFWSRFEGSIRGMRLLNNHLSGRRTFRADGILMKLPTQVDFEIEGVRVTVANYFAKTYAPLRHLELPLVIMRKGTGDNYIPMEVLSVVPGQRFRAQLNEEITTSMIGAAAKRPEARFKLINQRAHELAMLSNNTLKEFGMAFDTRMHTCKGVILPPPQILYGQDRKINVIGGSWNLKDVKARRGVNIPTWKVFVFARGRDMKIREDEAKKIIRDPGMLRMADAYGVKFGSNVKVQLVSTFEEYVRAAKAPFNLVVLADKSAQCYESVKQHSETVAGVITQCVLAKNLHKLTVPAFLGNLLLKINTKVGGHNWKLTAPLFEDKRTCLIGIDVNHPGVGDMNSPSVACIVGSTDYEFGNYHTVLLQQNRSVEIIEKMRVAILEILKAHVAKTKYKPERIVIFRDGVGDSMFDNVFDTEIKSVRESFKQLGDSYNPELNLIIAQKRHTVRFSSEGQNLIPGTVVSGLHNIGDHPVSDNIVSTQTPIFDFYLSSHTAIQGTARSVRYITILNGSKFKIDDLQKTIYHLCHLYMRATKSVSIVPPIYYAHLGATRGRCYFERNRDGIINMHQPLPIINKTLYYL